MNIENKIQRAVRRTEMAYNLYIESKLYFHALRIYKANKIVYALLEEFVFDCDESKLDEVFNYLFHLEDWFENFEKNQFEKPGLEDIFIFERHPKSISYPTDFIKSILK